MHDLLIAGATVVDGTRRRGASRPTSPCKDGRIVEVGRITGAAHERIDAAGAWLTPGFVDIHTHYDGQASWDETFSPSIHHGVTTLVMGNCGVGFAPVRKGRQADLIDLMEGVEDIPGVALAEGMRFDWESFPQYMDALARMPHSLDFLVQVPHDPLRMEVMGERALAGAAGHAPTTSPRCARWCARRCRPAPPASPPAAATTTAPPRARTRRPARPTRPSSTGIVAAFDGLQHGVLQVVSDFDLLRGPQRFDAEFDLVEQLARASGRPLSMTWLQRDPGGEQWKQIQARVEAGVAAGLPLYLQTAARGIGVINGLDASFHPFIGFPGYKAIAAAAAGRARRRDARPARKAR